MEFLKTNIEGLILIRPKIIGDERGYFCESYSVNNFKNAGLNYNFIQDNQSKSKYGTLRGLHYQTGEAAQAKLVRVVQGQILDVAVDIRPDSKTYGEHYAVELSEDNFLQLLIPRGFAHGFVVLSETAIVNYKCDNFYAPSAEGGIIFDDPALNIDWRVPKEKLILSPKDKLYPKLTGARKV